MISKNPYSNFKFRTPDLEVFNLKMFFLMNSNFVTETITVCCMLIAMKCSDI